MLIRIAELFFELKEKKWAFFSKVNGILDAGCYLLA